MMMLMIIIITMLIIIVIRRISIEMIFCPQKSYFFHSKISLLNYY